MTLEQKTKLESLGVDLEETLERFVDNEELYLRCLGKLLQDKNYNGMFEAIDSKDPSAAFDAAHALKGVTANLGLNRLYLEMKEITEVFRAGSLDYDSGNMERIKKDYEEVVDTIKAL